MELTIPQALQKGISAHQSGKLKDAENFYRAILKAQPNNPHANHNLGALAAQLGRFEEALPLFKQAIDANSSEEQYWLSYMHLLINMGRVSDASDILEQSRNFGLSKNKIKEIEDILGRSHEDTILSKELDNLLGLYNSRKFEKALEYGHSLAIQFPDTPSILHLLGTIKSALGMVKEARLDYERVLEIKPDSSDTYNNMATLLKRTGHLDNAKLAYKKAIVLYPNYIDANYNFANLLNEGRYYEGALTLYNRALTIKYDFPEAHTNLGTILKNLNRNREAINAFRNAIKFKPDSTEAHFNLGSSLEEAGELLESIQSYKAMLTLTPNKLLYYSKFFELNKNKHLYPVNEQGLSKKTVFKVLGNETNFYQNYLKDVGVFASKANNVVNGHGLPIPKLTNTFLHWFETQSWNESRLLELGSGNSTLYFAKFFKTVTSFETDQKWYEKILTTLPINAKIFKVTSILESLENVVLDDFDVILIDAAENRAKLSRFLNKASYNGLVFFDNAEWYRKSIAIFCQDQFCEIPFFGIKPTEGNISCTSILAPASKITAFFNYRWASLPNLTKSLKGNAWDDEHDQN
ncbi:tetratricopeptide repeat protein [Alphaproteobacteria bacterium]|nr:tetratricopeptide repeat protein [Alphaproteobacteria bacterium]